METSLLLLALSKTLPESCLQGLVVYLALQLLFALYKKSTPVLRFNFYYAATVCLFLGFLFTFFNHYQETKDAVFTGTFLPTSQQANTTATIAKPTTWLQLSYWTGHYAYAISGLYFVGLLFCILRLALGLINISWFKNSGNLQLENQLSAQVKKLSLDFNLIKTVLVFLSDKIQVPLTIGFFKPIIVFPIALINQLSAEQTEAILLHELAHIKRHDYLLNVLLSIIQSFLFFNPVIWLMSREINKYREQCCDDLVLEKTEHQLAYARALLLIEENRSMPLTLALASNGKKYTLLNRIKRITNMKTNDLSSANKLFLLLLIIATIGISVAWNMPVKKALKHQIMHNLKIVETKNDGSKSEISADEVSVVHKVSDSKRVNFLLTNKIVFQPNKKSGKKITFSGKQLVVQPWADTVIKSKNKFKIVLEDSTGNKKEYNSIEELPANEQKEFLKENGKLNSMQKLMVVPGMNFRLQRIPGLTDTIILDRLNSPSYKIQTEAIKGLTRKQIAARDEKIRLHFNSPEFKKQMEDLRKQSGAIGEQARKQFDSPEFKLQMEKLRDESKAMGEQANKQFNSPEFKKQVENMRIQGNLMRKQGEEMRKYYQSPEWKIQQKKMQKEIEKSQKAWKKSYDEQPKLIMPEKPNAPQDL